jgi:hypothetical protein
MRMIFLLERPNFSKLACIVDLSRPNSSCNGFRMKASTHSSNQSMGIISIGFILI